jgi:hypothetical protein
MRFVLATVLMSAAVLSGCSVNVKKDDGGDEKKVDIKTPFTDIHVEKNADARDTGLPNYPGAKLKPKTGADDSSANVNLSAFGFGLKVVVLKYETDDSPDKVQKFYEREMKKFGSVLQCHTSHSGDYDGSGMNRDSSGQLKCSGDNRGNIVELKAGSEGNQHIVSIQPEGKGTEFDLVYVHTHGKDDTI